MSVQNGGNLGEGVIDRLSSSGAETRGQGVESLNQSGEG